MSEQSFGLADVDGKLQIVATGRDTAGCWVTVSESDETWNIGAAAATRQLLDNTPVWKARRLDAELMVENEYLPRLWQSHLIPSLGHLPVANLGIGVKLSLGVEALRR
ncbi:hypothetical protein QC763_0071500 [Podospora pseudopauciseta]|uniref:Uncharacterized protein n=1 Tax=Podospora pseudopauciseta TaxID=2093780 RepID=A0ABR0HE14_9PEZI|nr:hypothetical protein QC763_0071500 [Podospora pseudopauciseta]